MNTAPVANLDDERLIREGEHAVDLYNTDLKNARARIMPMARGLLAAKRKYPATQDFGDWLKASSYNELGKDDRAALIKIGEHEEFAGKVVRITSLVSPRTIWDAIEEMLPTSHDANSTSGLVSPPESSPASTVTVEDDRQSGSKQRRLAPHSAARSLPRAEEIVALFTDCNTRVTINKFARERWGRQIWSMMLQARDAGFLTVNNRHLKKYPSLALLFPAAAHAYAARFDLSLASHREQVGNEILPAMIACKDQLLAEPARIREILNEHAKTQVNRQREIVRTEKRETAVKALPSTEQQLVMFGQTVWPRLDNSQGEYDYDQIRAAIWTFRGYESWNVLGKESTQSLAIRIRNVTRYLGEYMNRCDRSNHVNKILSLISWLSFLMEQNPTAECKWPMYPHVEGQW